jgi:hypothetical protein
MRKCNGVVLLTAIFIVLLISTLGIGYLSLVNNQMEIVNVACKSVQSFYCAETGTSEAVLYLKNISNWQGLSGVLISGNFENGFYQVEIDLGSPPAKDVITVKSTGTMANFQRIIQVTLDKSNGIDIMKQAWKEI